MDKQQKIVEMAKDICRVKHICNDPCKPISACDALRYAERAVEGYSKQRKGKWISVEGDVIFKCSICEAEVSTSWDYENDDMWRYCPVCGAKMDGEMEGATDEK